MKHLEDYRGTSKAFSQNHEDLHLADTALWGLLLSVASSSLPSTFVPTASDFERKMLGAGFTATTTQCVVLLQNVLKAGISFEYLILILQRATTSVQT